MDSKVVAILLAVYNGERHVNALLDSLLQQTYRDIVIYIRDNCSKDNSQSLLLEWQHRYPDKIFLSFAEKNKGCISNFSSLLNASKEPYVMFCDHDDIWLSDKVSLTLSKMDELESVYGKEHPIAVHTDLTIVDDSLNVTADSFWKASCLNTSEACYNFSRLLVQNQVTGCTLMMNRSLVELATPIPSQCIMHDWWIALVASCFGKIGVVEKATILYRQHASNDTGAKPYGIFSYFLRKKRAKVLLKIRDASNGKSKQSITDKKREQAKLFINRYQNLLSQEDVKTALAYLKLQQVSFPMAFLLLIRHRFFKTGFLRNFILNH